MEFREKMFSKKALPRWRAFSLIFIHVLFGFHYLHWKLTGRTFAPLEFSESLYTLHAGILTLGFIFTVVAILGTLVFGRFFCGWGCHILALQDLSAWVLARFGIRPKPIRSRIILWVPLATFLYMFLWPQVARLLAHQPRPPFTINRASEGWSSFVTTDLLRAMPGLTFTFLTFLVCGFLIVYFLGSRSFCYSVCPYGVFFGWTDRVSPGPKIILAGGCEGCGLCTQNCKSGVNVIQEIKKFGAVVDKNCLKSMDCVAICPTEALAVGFTAPPLILEKRKGASRRPAKKYDCNWSEEILFAAVFFPLVPVYRGLYGYVGVLLAVGIAAIGGASAVRFKRPAENRRRLLPHLASSVFLAFTLHSAFVHYHAYVGGEKFRLGFYPLGARGEEGNGGTEAIREAVGHLRIAYDWGILKGHDTERMLALAYANLGQNPEARRFFKAYLDHEGRDPEIRIQFGNFLSASGLPAEADGQYRLAIVPDSEIRTGGERSQRAIARSLVAQYAASKGDTAEALEQLRLAVQDNPLEMTHYCNYGMLRIQSGDWRGASEILGKARNRFGDSDCIDYLLRMLESIRAPGSGPIK